MMAETVDDLARRVIQNLYDDAMDESNPKRSIRACLFFLKQKAMCRESGDDLRNE